MKAQELRTMSVEEVESKVKGWRDELFQARIRFNTSELKDTSQFGKLRKDIARGLMVLGELKGSATQVSAEPQDKPVSAKPADKESTEA